MYDFDALVDEVIRNKPEISRSSLMELVQEKKRTVGSGYLTDQGALFLIAGELGVKLQHMITADLTLKDLHIGANDITVVARVSGDIPDLRVQEEGRKRRGRYRRVNLFDRNGIGRLTIWEDNEEAMKTLWPDGRHSGEGGQRLCQARSRREAQPQPWQEGQDRGDLRFFHRRRSLASLSASVQATGRRCRRERSSSRSKAWLCQTVGAPPSSAVTTGPAAH